VALRDWIDVRRLVREWRGDFRPLMGEAELRLIVRHLRETDVMLEWGCGGSTLAFAPRVTRYCSLEHDARWHARITTAVAARGLTNVTLRLVPPDLSLDGAPNYARSSADRYTQFRHYIEAAAEFGEPRFDRVLIDGRSRPECAAAVRPLLAPGAIVFIHDFFNTKYDVEPYHAAVLASYELVDAVRDGQTLAVFAPRT
jgi:predicted O-methyltransferase YrrM